MKNYSFFKYYVGGAAAHVCYFFCAAESQQRSPEELQELQDKCLLGIICEISDGFTQGMIEEVNQRISIKHE